MGVLMNPCVNAALTTLREIICIIETESAVRPPKGYSSDGGTVIVTDGPADGIKLKSGEVGDTILRNSNALGKADT